MPHDAKSQAELAAQIQRAVKTIQARVAQLHEANPMLGHRGCRLSVTYPGFSDAGYRDRRGGDQLHQQKKISVHPEIMIPLVGTVKELALLKGKVATRPSRPPRRPKVHQQARHHDRHDDRDSSCRAFDLRRDRRRGQFFSFGTSGNLTQMTFGGQPRRYRYLPAGIPAERKSSRSTVV
ncbi:MAG: putative PEP-binding protein [Pirellulaceae bacterium]